MTLTFSNVLSAVREIPLGSTTEQMVRWIDQNKAREGSFFKDNRLILSKEAIKPTIVRSLAASALPFISTLGFYYNIAAGTTRLCTAFVAHLKKQNSEARIEFAAAARHIMTAVYDFVVGYFLSIQYIGLALTLAAALLPHRSIPAHNAVFNKGDDENLEKCGIQKGAEKLTDLFLPTDNRSTFGQRFHTFCWGSKA